MARGHIRRVLVVRRTLVVFISKTVVCVRSTTKMLHSYVTSEDAGYPAIKAQTLRNIRIYFSSNLYFRKSCWFLLEYRAGEIQALKFVQNARKVTEKVLIIVSLIFFLELVRKRKRYHTATAMRSFWNHGTRGFEIITINNHSVDDICLTDFWCFITGLRFRYMQPGRL